MIALLIYGFAAGLGVGVAAGFSYFDFLRIRGDDKLRADNKDSQEEIKRLRAQVALHINRVADPASLNTPASTPSSHPAAAPHRT